MRRYICPDATKCYKIPVKCTINPHPCVLFHYILWPEPERTKIERCAPRKSQRVRFTAKMQNDEGLFHPFLTRTTDRRKFVHKKSLTMRTLNVKSLSFFTLLMCAGLIFLACNSTDLVNPVDKEEMVYTDQASVLPNDAKLHYEIDKDIIASNEEVGVCVVPTLDKPVKTYTIYQLLEFNVRTMTYAKYELPEKIENPYYMHEKFVGMEACMLMGEGQGWSEEMGRSIVTAKLEFHPLTMELKGEVMSEFYPSGDILKFKLEGHGEIVLMDEMDGPQKALVLAVRIEHVQGDHLRTVEEATSFLLNVEALMKPGQENFKAYLVTKGKMYE